MAKSGLAAGLAWAVAQAVTGAPDPVLAPLTALVVVQVSVRASIFTALQRSAAVVLGVLLAVAVGDLLELNGITVAVVVAVSLGVAQLVLRLPRAAARQVPVSLLVVLSAVAADQGSQAGRRALDTLLGAAVGIAVSLVLPASRLVDARQTLHRLADGLEGVLETMGSGLQQPWSTDQTGDWRRTARTVRDRLVDQASEAVGDGRETARWNVRDRRHVDELGRYEDVMPRLERTAIGVSVISEGSTITPAWRARCTGRCPPWVRSSSRCRGRSGRWSTMCSVRRRTLILPGRSPRFTPDGTGACRAHSAGLGWPSSTASAQPATWRASGSATPPCWCRSIGSSST